MKRFGGIIALSLLGVGFLVLAACGGDDDRSISQMCAQLESLESSMITIRDLADSDPEPSIDAYRAARSRGIEAIAHMLRAVPDDLDQPAWQSIYNLQRTFQPLNVIRDVPNDVELPEVTGFFVLHANNTLDAGARLNSTLECV